MRYGDESVQAMEFAYAALTTSPEVQAALNDLMGGPVQVDAHVWPDPAPRDSPDPVIVYSTTDPQDRRAVGDLPRLNSRVPLLVKVVGEGRDSSRLAPLARALYSTLHGRRGFALGDSGTVLTCLRTSALSYPESADGIHYVHLGHLFQVEID